MHKLIGGHENRRTGRHERMARVAGIVTACLIAPALIPVLSGQPPVAVQAPQNNPPAGGQNQAIIEQQPAINMQQPAPFQAMPLAERGRRVNIAGQPLNGPQRTTATATGWFQGQVTAASVRRAIADAVFYLKSVQAADGSMEESIIHYSTGAGTVMGTLALLAAGADPESDDAVRRALRWLEKNDQSNTYFRAVRANVWEYALRKAANEDYLRTALKGDWEWLLKALGKKEGWRYEMTSTDWDNSVTQYGVLGIWAAARAGLEPPEDFWPCMSRHFLACQNADGGWSYQAHGGSSANMVTAGLAALFLVFDKYHGQTYYTAGSPNPFATGAAAEFLKAIDKGMAWLGKSGGNNQDGYYLYGMERAGVASGRKYIGDRDWFIEGANLLLRSQQADGSFALSGYGGRNVHTAFGLLFLVYGGAPVAINKLEYGRDQEWNLNPRDVANVTKHLWLAYEKPLNWHSVGIQAPVEEFEAPILFISGHRDVTFTPVEVAKLRAYIERGGTILAEPADSNAAFRISMERLVTQIYPPETHRGYALQALPAEHVIYRVLQQDWTRPPALRGASNGSRVFFLLSDGYLAADWQMDKTGSDAFKLAMNLVFYVTDAGELKGKRTSILPETAPAPVRNAVARVAAVKWGDGASSGEWETGGGWWQRFAPYFKHVTGATVEERPAVTLGRDELKGLSLLCLCGRSKLTLNADEASALKQFVSRGGTVLFNAYGGAPDFAASAHETMQALFGPSERLSDDHDLAAGRFWGGVDLSRRLQYTLSSRRLLRERNANERGQSLVVVMQGRRPAVILSEHDLAGPIAGALNYGAKTYKADSARKVLANILAYASAE